VLGAYNPFTFLLEGSDLLQSLLNGVVKEVTEKFPNAVYTDAFLKINPQRGGEGNAKERETICKYTEMCNAQDQERNVKKAEATATKEKGEGKIITYPPNPIEGDIHPTVAGAKLLAGTLFKVYTP